MSFMKLKPLTESMRFTSVLAKEDISEEIINLLDKDEVIKFSYSASRDIAIITNMRILVIDRKGVRGFRRSLVSVTYNMISAYSLDVNNMDCRIEMIVTSGHKLILDFYKPIPLENMFDVYKYISHKILEK